MTSNEQLIEIRSAVQKVCENFDDDYWAEKEGPYDVMKKEKEEYILTQDDIDSDYSETDMKQSFNAVQDDDYDEEDL